MTIGFLLGVIPSPSSGSIHLGPLRLNAYGLMIAIGVITAVRIAGRHLLLRQKLFPLNQLVFQ